ncbi:MAG TPA: threonine synthase [Ktedonobacteraceae bacterium]|nr:threonine synthase [Ktedonobacteraceae bacterium]
MGTYSAGLEPGQSDKQALSQVFASLSLRCVECAALYPAVEAQPRYRCECGGVLDVETIFQHSSPQEMSLQEGFDALASAESDLMPLAGASWRQLFDERATRPPIWPMGVDSLLLDRSGVWRYRELILPLPPSYIVSRPEGNTSLYPAGIENCSEGCEGHQRIGKFAGIDRLFLKHEGENPSGSFKDRGMTVGVSMARATGARAVACASTGNTSASLASYAAQAGMPCLVFLPAGNVAAGKLAQTLAYGATTIQINGDFDDAMRLVEQVCNELGIYLLNSLNPYRIEGQKAIGLELLQQLDWQAPDWLVLPAGNLGNTSAIGKALLQARQLGLIGYLPRIASIQASGANPFYRSYINGFANREHVQARTIATAIKIGNPVSYTRARRVIEQTNGVVEEVSDEEILAAKTVIDRAGIGCEPASAATLAGMRKLVERGVINRDERVVGILTGHLLKDSATALPRQSQNAVVEANIDAVRKLLHTFL